MVEEPKADDGHETLIRDVTNLLVDIELFKFHDFHPNGHETPKLALVNRLKTLMEYATTGMYDN